MAVDSPPPPRFNAQVRRHVDTVRMIIAEIDANARSTRALALALGPPHSLGLVEQADAADKAAAALRRALEEIGA